MRMFLPYRRLAGLVGDKQPSVSMSVTPAESKLTPPEGAAAVVQAAPLRAVILTAVRARLELPTAAARLVAVEPMGA